MDVGLEVVGVCDRPETWCQRGEGSKSHVVATVADLSRIIVLLHGHDLRSRLSCRVTDRTLGVLKDRYGEPERGSEWEPIKILLEGDGDSNKTNTASNTRL
jgi:hypothetical protein